MIRLLVSLVMKLLANTVGLVAAALILDGFSISGLTFVLAVLIFTAVEVIIDPLLVKMSLNNLPALRGGVALVTTFVGLLVTDLISDGLSITGVSTWILASLIVWLFTLLAAVILPLFLFKKTLAARKEDK